MIMPAPDLTGLFAYQSFIATVVAENNWAKRTPEELILFCAKKWVKSPKQSARNSGYRLKNRKPTNISQKN